MARRMTRVFDVGMSSVLLLITLPVIVLTAVLLWLENPGPIFERQRRIGNAGRPFTLLRFRTLSVAPEPHVASEKVAPYTPVGAVIHRLYLDELPQLLNILRGEMSFAGPRPGQPRLPKVKLVHTRERRLTQRRCQADRRGTLRWHSHGGDRRYRLGRRKDDKWDTVKTLLSRLSPTQEGRGSIGRGRKDV
jgi:lipopolysaccharide/colanic/teichoic acid biosynthesis glycosyltransferase